MVATGRGRWVRSARVGRLRVLAALAVVLAATAAAPAGAAEPLAFSDTGTTPRWTAHRITSTGGAWTIRFDLAVDDDPVAVGVMLYEADDRWRGGFTYTAFQYQDAVYTDVTVLPGTPVHVRERRNSYGGFDLPITLGMAPLPGTPEAPRTFKVLLWAIGDTARGWRYEARGAGIAVDEREGAADATTTGTRSLLALSRDLPAPAQATLQASAPPVPGQLPNGIGPGVRATVAGELPFVVADALFTTVSLLGQGSPAGVQGGDTRLHAENGLSADCSRGCGFYELRPVVGLGRGRYRYTTTGAGAGLGPFGDLLITAMDVRLPG